jgi:hypothetical protein
MMDGNISADIAIWGGVLGGRALRLKGGEVFMSKNMGGPRHAFC